MLYHVSPTRGLARLEPRVSTHGVAYVYAVESLATALLFGASCDDFDFDISTDPDGRPTASECWPGAFERVYAGKSCSVYTLAGDGFERGKTSWDAELVSSRAVDVLSEEVVPDLLARLLALEAAGALTLRRYENTPEYKRFVASHVADRLIRFGVDLDRALADGGRWTHFKPLIEGLRDFIG